MLEWLIEDVPTSLSFCWHTCDGAFGVKKIVPTCPLDVVLISFVCRTESRLEFNWGLVRSGLDRLFIPLELD